MKKIACAALAGMALLILLLSVSLFTSFVQASDADVTEPEASSGTQTEDPKIGSDSGNGMAYLAAALSTGLATVGAGIAVAVAGSAALGAISEDPKLLGKTLIFVGLAEGIAIYGLIISIMILNKV